MAEVANGISEASLDAIVSFLADGKSYTLIEVAKVYDKVMPIWLRYEPLKVKKQWAHAHLQYLNGKERRQVLTDGKVWRMP